LSDCFHYANNILGYTKLAEYLAELNNIINYKGALSLIVSYLVTYPSEALLFDSSYFCMCMHAPACVCVCVCVSVSVCLCVSSYFSSDVTV
jgi:hypothetical protein